MKNKPKIIFGNLTISQQFMIAGFIILLGGLIGIGAWVQKQIETGVIHRTGATTAIYVDSFVAPNLQDLRLNENLTESQKVKLLGLLQNTSMGNQIVSFKVWDTQGKLLFTTDNTQTGIFYPLKEGLLKAREGQVSSEISSLEDVENAPLAGTHNKLLETYSPIWARGSDEIIGVAEFYQLADDLDAEILVLKRQSWLVVGLVILLMYVLLSVFIRRISNTISSQQVELAQKVDELTLLLEQNEHLRGEVQVASASVAILNEAYLKKIGTDLHDGPAQDLALAILKIDTIIGKLEASTKKTGMLVIAPQLTDVETSIQGALKEMREIASGLSLPELAGMTFPETIEHVIRRHERKTGARVTLTIQKIPVDMPVQIKITVYRLIQEALNNTFKYAGESTPEVTLFQKDQSLNITIEDQGPGFDVMMASAEEGHLGLRGMGERIKSLGGRFRVSSQVGKGTTISASLPIDFEGKK